MARKSSRISTKSTLSKWIKKHTANSDLKENYELLKGSLRESTFAQYTRILILYEIVLKEKESPFPLTFVKLCRFIRGLLKTQVSSKTIGKYISGLKTLNQINGYQPLSISDNELLKRAIKSAKKAKPAAISKQANVLTPTQFEILKRFKPKKNLLIVYMACSLDELKF
jgi:hypothetical protein